MGFEKLFKRKSYRGPFPKSVLSNQTELDLLRQRVENNLIVVLSINTTDELIALRVKYKATPEEGMEPKQKLLRKLTLKVIDKILTRKY